VAFTRIIKVQRSLIFVVASFVFLQEPGAQLLSVHHPFKTSAYQQGTVWIKVNFLVPTARRNCQCFWFLQLQVVLTLDIHPATRRINGKMKDRGYHRQINLTPEAMRDVEVW